MGIG
jgi:hypothetical protein